MSSSLDGQIKSFMGPIVCPCLVCSLHFVPWLTQVLERNWTAATKANPLQKLFNQRSKNISFSACASQVFLLPSHVSMIGTCSGIVRYAIKKIKKKHQTRNKNINEEPKSIVNYRCSGGEGRAPVSLISFASEGKYLLVWRSFAVLGSRNFLPDGGRE